MTPRLEELAERALARCDGEAQVTATRERSLLARFAHCAPSQATAVDAVRVSVLRVCDGHTGLATVSGDDDEDLADAARRAGHAAKAAARGGPGAYPGLPPAADVREHGGFDPDTARRDPDAGPTAVEEVCRRARDRGLEAFGIWTSGAVETVIASTAGVRARDAVTDAHVKVLVRHPGGRTGYAADTARAVSDLDPGAVAERASARVSDDEPADLPPGEYPVVLAPEAVGELLSFLGALAFNGLVHAEHRGALSESLGTRVVSAHVNLSDSPRLPGGLPRACDAEGVPKAPLPLIQDGVAQAVVHDTASAAMAGDGARSTGHALAPGGARTGPEPTNLYLVGGGARDEDELAETIGHGVYVTRLWYVNAVHAKRTLVTGMTRDGTFLIEDGRIGRPLRDVRFTDSVLRLLAETEALTARPRLVSSTEYYGERFAHGVVCPALRARGFRVTGGTV